MSVSNSFVKWCTFHCEVQGFRSCFERNKNISTFEKTWGIFVVPGPVLTKWKLDLVLFENEDKEKCFKYMFRNLTEEGNCKISAHFRFGLHDAKDNCIYTSSIFESIDICSGIIAFTEFSETSDSSGSLLDFLMVKCEAYAFVTLVNMPENIFSEHQRRGYESENIRNLSKNMEKLYKEERRRSELENIRNLSKNMEKLYKEEQQTDLEIRLKDGQIKTHKAILCARIPFFSEILQEENKTFVELKDAEKGVMDKLLSFIYSGNLEELSIDDYSPFKLQEYVKRYGVEDITRFFSVQRHFSYTKLVMKGVDFRWSIKNFSPYEENLSSSEFQPIDDFFTAWRMELHFSGNETMDLYVKMRGNVENELQNVICSVSLLDGGGRRVHKEQHIVPLMCSSDSRRREISFYRFLRRNDLTCFNKGEVLNLHCSLRYAVKSNFSSVEEDFKKYDKFGLFSEDGSQKYDSLQLLSADYGMLLKNRTHSDVVLIAGSREFRAHRAVLSARSPVFSAMFRHDMLEKKTGVVVIEDIEPDVLGAHIYYIYTRKVYTGDLYKKTDALYYAADKYAITSLAEMCPSLTN